MSVALYKRRGEGEKVFDEIKKTGGKKAWARGLVAREAPALLIALTHHRLLTCEPGWERHRGVTNQGEDQRRAAAGHACGQKGTP